MMDDKYKELHDVTAKEWLARIKKVENVVLRRTVGWIVWWDYIADTEDSSILRDYLNQFDMAGQPKPKEIEQGLIQIGFYDEIAKKRSGHKSRYYKKINGIRQEPTYEV